MSAKTQRSLARPVEFAIALSVALLFGSSVSVATPVKPEYVRDFIKRLDSAVAASDGVLSEANLQALSRHSKKLTDLRVEGKAFGDSVLDAPYGRCYSAGVYASAWWQSKLTAARTGTEAIPGSIADKWKMFQRDRTECIASASSSQSPKPDTETIESYSETPPRKGCLKVFGVLPTGNVGTVAYTCPKN